MPYGTRILVVSSLALTAPTVAHAQGVTFTELADGAVDGYAKQPPPILAAQQALLEASLDEPVPLPAIFAAPMVSHGLVGVAILDYDLDGDLDIYATNGPGRANSLLANQLSQTGSVSFVDVGVASGVDATDQDSEAVCFGDTDNDGDPDLYVLGRGEPNRYYVNNGDGTFGLAVESGLEGGAMASSGCSMGDFDGDGLLDVVVANSFDRSQSFALFVEPYALNEHNQLFMNAGDNTFIDETVSSGVTENGGFTEGQPGITWGVAAVDVDADGDTDIVFGDDQGAITPERSCEAVPPGLPCLDRSLIHVFINDGVGVFEDHPIDNTPYAANEWMGFGFGDLDCNGTLDIFASSFGDYGNRALGFGYVDGSTNTRWMLGDGDGTFQDVGVGDLISTPFGWGAAVFDYDNDGDPDILFHGGLEAGPMIAIEDNPGTLLANEGCSANFAADFDAITSDHTTRNVRGVAVGDLDRDGFVDVATIANFQLGDESPLVPFPATGAVFDDTAFFSPVMVPVTPPEVFPPLLVWTGNSFVEGDLKVELSEGNDNKSVTIDLVGAVGIVTGGVVNRDGAGATIAVTPGDGATQTLPMVAGSSHASQHALERVFGLGDRVVARVDTLWPGGARNRLYGAVAGEHLQIPEIPCSYIGEFDGFGDYLGCVVPALAELRGAGVIDDAMRLRLLISSILAFFQP